MSELNGDKTKALLMQREQAHDELIVHTCYCVLCSLPYPQPQCDELKKLQSTYLGAMHDHEQHKWRVVRAEADEWKRKNKKK